MTAHNAREHNPQARRAHELMEHVEQEAARLHRQGTEVASHVADTEEQVAATLEEIAAHRPAADAERLRAEAEHARRHAARERDRSAEPPPGRPDHGHQA